jgi:hypothetical protein
VTTTTGSKKVVRSQLHQTRSIYTEPEAYKSNPWRERRRHETNVGQSRMLHNKPNSTHHKRADSKILRLKAEVIQVKEDLDRTKARLQSLADEREEALGAAQTSSNPRHAR